MGAELKLPAPDQHTAKFCKVVLPIITSSLTAKISEAPHLYDSSDPMSVDLCKRAVLSVDDDLLMQFEMMRLGGKVHIPHLDDYSAHAYFGSKRNPKKVVDFTVGQFAKHFNTTLDKWTKEHPHLFINKVLCAEKALIQSTLGLIYPNENHDFHDFFFK